MESGLAALPLKNRTYIIQKVLAMPYNLRSKMIATMFLTPLNLRSWIHPLHKSTWSGNWIFPNARNNETLAIVENRATSADFVLLFMHGGGFNFGFSTMYMKFFSQFTSVLEKYGKKVAILSVEYTHSPKTAWPAGKNEVVEAYRYLVHDLGIPPSKVICGGNLALTLLLDVLKKRDIPSNSMLPPLPMPAGSLLISPWVTLENNLIDFSKPFVDILSKPMLIGCVDNYLPQLSELGAEERKAFIQQPSISPLYGDFTGACPMLVVYGDMEILRESIQSFIKNVQKDGVNVNVICSVDSVHDSIISPLFSKTEKTTESNINDVAEWCAHLISKH
ncbi:Alpha/Beta hydrolase protein [Spinellus fusiger]|nr:Alpha/Beta hydrolase protein [Spinellus fusiger]